MNKRLYWGLAALVILIGVVGIILMVTKDTNTKQKKVYKPAPTEQVSPIAEGQRPPDVPGFKGVRHGDHWDKVEITEPVETKDTEVDKPMEATKSQNKTYEGPLTYHKELLETNPVEALRQQSIERGHWSAAYIPPFPQDDQVAASFARVTYHTIYYRLKGERNTTPEGNRAGSEFMSQLDSIADYPGVYGDDLMRITWACISQGDAMQYPWPSNYDLPLSLDK